MSRSRIGRDPLIHKQFTIFASQADLLDELPNASEWLRQQIEKELRRR
jgi:hypothetical protein